MNQSPGGRQLIKLLPPPLGQAMHPAYLPSLGADAERYAMRTLLAAFPVGWAR